MSKIMVGGINLHYWRVGEGPDVVLLHGLWGNLAVWHLKMVPLLRKDFRVTTYDLRGHGHSDIPPTGYTTADMASDLKGLLDALEMERVHLIGHSLGADIALHCALLYPERVSKIVAIEAGIPALLHKRMDEDWVGWKYWVNVLEKFDIEVPPEKRHDPYYLLRKSLNVPILYGPAKGRQRKQEQLLKLLDETTMIEDYQDPAGMTLERLGQLQHAVMLIYGHDSPYLETYDVLRDLLSECTPILLPATEYRHFSPLEQPELLLNHIEPFLSDSSVS